MHNRERLQVGQISAILENGQLRDVRVGNCEVIRGIYVAVRDENWSTVHPEVSIIDTHLGADDIQIELSVLHKHGEMSFSWRGKIQIQSSGMLNFSMDGVANTSFLKNRIGFCVLHPMELAGRKVTVYTPTSQVDSIFPKLISPHQPFKEIRRMVYAPCDEVGIELQFHGDLFEMEDQRNWTDASYKTYCTPLDLPFPVQVQAGEQINQSITMNVIRGVDCPSHISGNTVQKAEVFLRSVGRVPDFGTELSQDVFVTDEILRLLSDVKFGHIRHTVKLLNPNWQQNLAEAIAIVRRLGIRLHLELVSDDNAAFLLEFADAIKPDAELVTTLFVFSDTTHISSESLVKRLVAICNDAGLSIPVFGGTRAFFAELNRATLPLHALDGIGYTINPQVHAFDDVSLMETLSAQPETIRTARAKVGHLPIILGPMTMKMRFNPNATNVDDAVPAESDPRQQTLFCAAWTAGSLANVLPENVAGLTYFQAIGESGICADNGTVYPVYHVLEDVGSWAGADVLHTFIDDPHKVQLLAMKRDNQVRVMLANLTDEEKDVKLLLTRFVEGDIRYLDGTNVQTSMKDPGAYRIEHVMQLLPNDADLVINLRPYAIVTLNVTL